VLPGIDGVEYHDAALLAQGRIVSYRPDAAGAGKGVILALDG
jgi:hypothetical protein